ncbi:MAG: transporter [Rhodanobacter sp.]
MHRNLLAAAIACGLLISLPGRASTPQDTAGEADADDVAAVRALERDLQALKASYADEVRKLRALDVQVQALQARLSGQTAGSALPAQPAAPDIAATNTPSHEANGMEAGTRAEADQAARDNAQNRSLEDALQQQNAAFNRKLTIENGLTYSRYDRKELTLNGFLALDAIFLGNISIDRVASDSLTYDFVARYGASPRLTLNLDVPYLARRTTYQKGGAGGSAAAIGEESTSGTGIGDVNFAVNYKLFGETTLRPDTLLTVGVTAPTGRAPYGINWNTVSRSGDQYLQFAVPERQPTGNGVWQGTLGLTAVKTIDPAIVFANLGYIHSFERSFGDIDTDPQTRTPGSVKLGDAYYFGAGVAFAFNERASLSLSFSDRINGKASLQPRGKPSAKVIGSDANAATFNMGVTYALDQHTTLVSMLGVGLTADAPDFTLTFKVPYTF